MTSQDVIFVCTSCASDRAVTQQTGKSGGEQLLDQLQNLGQSWSLREQVSIQSVQCMGVCDRECAIAFSGSHKRTYLFGNLPVDPARLESTAAAVLDCASRYHATVDGILKLRERPELLKTRVLARIPPIPVPHPSAAPLDHSANAVARDSRQLLVGGTECG